MYHLRATLATTRRLFQQIAHDPRSIVLIFVAPIILMSLLWWLYSDNTAVFDRIAPALLALFPFMIMFMITAISTLRERRSGTLERVLITRIAKIDFIAGYALSFGLLAVGQALVVSIFSFWVLGMDTMGPAWFVVLVALANALLGTMFGILASAFARTEFQAIQFIPLFIIPQFFAAGILVPLAQMPDLLEKIAWFLPLTYAVNALNYVSTHADLGHDAWRSLIAVLLFALGAVVVSALSLRRREK